MSTNWKKILFNIQNIETETEKAILINLPHNSEYDGWSLWIAKKLIKEGTHSYTRSILCTDSFTFTIKNGDDEKNITANELEEIFKNKC